MEFPINMTGYAQGLHLFRCICKGCGNDYFLHPSSNLISDSGMCAVCEDLVRQVDACYRAPRFEFRPVNLHAQKEVGGWAALVGIMGALVFSAFAWWGILSVARHAARYLWRLL